MLERVTNGFVLVQAMDCPNIVYNKCILPCLRFSYHARPTFTQLVDILGEIPAAILSSKPRSTPNQNQAPTLVALELMQHQQSNQSVYEYVPCESVNPSPETRALYARSQANNSMISVQDYGTATNPAHAPPLFPPHGELKTVPPQHARLSVDCQSATWQADQQSGTGPTSSHWPGDGNGVTPSQPSSAPVPPTPAMADLLTANAGRDPGNSDERVSRTQPMMPTQGRAYDLYSIQSRQGAGQKLGYETKV